MKTTLEIPDRIFRKAKSKAAEKGIPFRQFVTDAVEDKLKESRAIGSKPWMKHVGKLKHLRKETLRVPEGSRRQATVLGHGAEAVPELVRVLDELGVLS